MRRPRRLSVCRERLEERRMKMWESRSRFSVSVLPSLSLSCCRCCCCCSCFPLSLSLLCSATGVSQAFNVVQTPVRTCLPVFSLFHHTVLGDSVTRLTIASKRFLSLLQSLSHLPDTLVTPAFIHKHKHKHNTQYNSRAADHLACNINGRR